jgi:glycosyltransferase involved in cell wall biosynthesis
LIDSIRWAAVVDEIIVAENGSIDDTAALARAAGAKVILEPQHTIGAQRNAAIAVARNEWILVLDADERCTPELATEIEQVIANPQNKAYRIPRKNFFLGREVSHGGWERDKPIRLFRKELRYNNNRVHESVKVDGVVGELKCKLLHYPYTSLDQYFEKFNRYAQWWAEQNYEKGRRTGALPVIVKPPAKFISMFLLRGGFLDGATGAVVAALASASVMAKYARLWEMTVKGRKI